MYGTVQWCDSLLVWKTLKIEFLGPLSWERFVLFLFERCWCCHCFSCCCFQWMLTLRYMLTFTKGERGQVVQRKKRRLERESEMGSTLIWRIDNCLKYRLKFKKMPKINQEQYREALFVPLAWAIFFDPHEAHFLSTLFYASAISCWCCHCFSCCGCYCYYTDRPIFAPEPWSPFFVHLHVHFGH